MALIVTGASMGPATVEKWARGTMRPGIGHAQMPRASSAIVKSLDFLLQSLGS